MAASARAEIVSRTDRDRRGADALARSARREDDARVPDLHYRIYTFDQPLQPGQRTEVRFETVREQRGFRNTNNEMRVVENGVFIDNWQFAPILGPNRFVLLADRTQRRKFGLPDEIRPPALEDESAARITISGTTAIGSTPMSR